MASGFAPDATLIACEAGLASRSDSGTLGRASNTRRSFAIATLLFLVLLLPILRGFDQPAKAMDEGSLLVYPELILKGHLPYRDFETFYGPANIYVLSGVYAVFGPGVLAERVVGLVYRLLILAAFFCIGRRWGTTIAAGMTLIAGATLLAVGVVAYAWMGGIACGLWSILASSHTESRYRTFLGGILAGMAVLFRPDLGPAVILGSFLVLLTMGRSARLRWFGGICLGLLPLALLAIVAGPRRIFDNLFLFPVIHSNPGRHLPLAQVPDPLLGLLAAHLVASGMSVLAGGIALRRNPQQITARILFGAALFALALTHQAIQRLDGMHICFAAFASLALLPASFFVLLSTISFATPWRKSLMATGLALVFVTAFVPALPVYFGRQVGAAFDLESPAPVILQHNGRSIPMPKMSLARTTGLLLERIERTAVPGDRLFIGPSDLRRTNYNDTFLYHMLPDLLPASYFLEMNPGSANRPNSRLASDIHNADWLILNRAYDDWSEPNASGWNGPDEPNVLVAEEFTLRGQFGNYLLYHHKLRR